MDLNSLIQLKRERLAQLEGEISDPRLFDNRKRAEEIMRERASLTDLLGKWRELETARKQLDDNRELATSRDVEIAAMADDEIPELEDASSILNAAFRLPCCQPIKPKSATQSWKSAPEQAEAKRRSSPPIFTVCTIATRKLPG